MNNSIVKRRGWTKRRILIVLGWVVLAGGMVAIFVFDVSPSAAVAFGTMALVHPLLHMFGGHGHGGGNAETGSGQGAAEQPRGHHTSPGRGKGDRITRK